MLPFEYITVLISIILGMGITQILSGLANIILRWETVETYWPHSLLALLVFIFHIQEWWVTYEMRNFQYWRLPVFLFIILYPVNLYILVRILFPMKWIGKGISLKAFYYENYRKIYLFVFTLSILSIIDNVLISSIGVLNQVPQFLVASVSGLITFFNVKTAWMHKLVVIFLALLTTIAFIVAWDQLAITNEV